MKKKGESSFAVQKEPDMALVWHELTPLLNVRSVVVY